MSSAADSQEYEYGILFRGHPDEPHRSHMTEEEARQWLYEWVEMGGSPDAFSLIRRPIGAWVTYE